MDEGAGGDTGDDPVPDLADDLVDRLPSGFEAIDPGRLFGFQCRVTHAHIPHPTLEPVLKVQTPDDPARHDGDGQAEGEIG
jgi:hypothetical protein